MHYNLRYRDIVLHTVFIYQLFTLVWNITFCLFRYYQCFWGQTYSFSCPAGTLWSTQRQYCDWSYNVQCKFILTCCLFLLKKYPNLTNDITIVVSSNAQFAQLEIIPVLLFWRFYQLTKFKLSDFIKKKTL